MSASLKLWEQAEVERSASEAARANFEALRAGPQNLARYFAPPADTVYPLEYCFHLLSDVRGKTILEYGCGDGVNTILLAGRGARVIALDISPDLIEIAKRRMEVNGVTSDVEFVVGSAHDLPMPDESVDIVFGIAILHHLDLARAACEVRRALRKGGCAIFKEPVRNSKMIKFASGIIPYRAPDVSPYERPLTDEELRSSARAMRRDRSNPFRCRRRISSTSCRPFGISYAPRCAAAPRF